MVIRAIMAAVVINKKLVVVKKISVTVVMLKASAIVAKLNAKMVNVNARMAQTVVGISVIVEARSKLNQQIKSTNQVKEVQ
jgi:hypothetical protein